MRSTRRDATRGVGVGVCRPRTNEGAVTTDTRRNDRGRHSAPTDRRPRMGAREISLRVDMVCEGCAGAVKRICARIEGVESVRVDVDSRLVVIRGDALDPDDVCARVAKCGRETRVLSASA